jgi:UDP-glucuronate 4-epimerase
MSILITGGAGFIGSHLAERLLRETLDKIVLVDNFNEYYDSRLKRKNLTALLGQSRILLEEGDFRDFDYCRRLLARHGPTCIAHLGAYPGVPLSLKEPKLYAESNILATIGLLEAAREFPVNQFLFASSSTVYGRGAPPPFVEDAPLGVPASPYGATKRSAEILGLTWHQLYGVPFTSLRFFNVYGPRLRPELALAVFTRKILAGEALPLYGDGTVTRDFTHVSDICDGVIAAMRAPGVAGQCINLGHNEPVAMRRLIALIESAARKPANIEYCPARSEDLPVTCADLTKANRLLGYSPRVSLEEGVQEYVRWVQESARLD